MCLLSRYCFVPRIALVTLRSLNRVATLSPLHAGVVGAPASLGCAPNDVLTRVLDVTGFTMQTVLRIDLKSAR